MLCLVQKYGERKGFVGGLANYAGDHSMTIHVEPNGISHLNELGYLVVDLGRRHIYFYGLKCPSIQSRDLFTQYKLTLKQNDILCLFATHGPRLFFFFSPKV